LFYKVGKPHKETPNVTPKRVTRIGLLYNGIRVVVNTLRTGDADLRFYVTTVQEG